MTTTLAPPTFAPSMTLNQYLTMEEDVLYLAGTKIGLWQIVRAYLAGDTPEQIVLNYQGVSLTQVYTAITYYLTHQEMLTTAVEPIDSQPALVQQLRERLDGRYQVTSDANRVQLTPL
jgi:uncharacterized protein (DUF433 family)